jgi:hypothetical protein
MIERLGGGGCRKRKRPGDGPGRFDRQKRKEDLIALGLTSVF